MPSAVQDLWPVTQTKSTENTEPQTKNMRKFFCPEDGGDQARRPLTTILEPQLGAVLAECRNS